MYYLCVETSSKLGSLALAKKNSTLNLLEHKEWMRSKDIKNKKVFSHAELITTEFQSLLDKHSINLSDISALLITHGPGSFTGLRVGLNFVKSLAYSLNIPIYSTDTLSSMAWAARELNQNIHVVCNAQKNLVFYAQYQVENKKLSFIEKPQLKSLKDLKVNANHVYVGDGLINVHQDFKLAKSDYNMPKAKTLIELYNQQFEFFKKNQWNSLKPLYLKASEAEENLKKGLLKPIN
ncbi:MAG: tRNA (adenosine(37)-N6)-threonylcarbamoyltransferase complex dimerization subunit type 1 TsaB [Bdellovibrionales bacterium]|nr:tRNA (adenosine(37)-N6)-threonylcarbamoyltransferase complex dimerization subunit type 1 TsaB [Bdellovibrionales bacterium]